MEIKHFKKMNTKKKKNIKNKKFNLKKKKKNSLIF